MAQPKRTNRVSTALEQVEQKDKQAAAEVIEHLTAEEPNPDARPTIEPIDQAILPPPPIGKPLPIVDIEEAAQAGPVHHVKGVNFFCGELGLIRFSDKTTHHVKTRHFFVSDPVLIKKLKEAAENPTNKIFISDPA